MKHVLRFAAFCFGLGISLSAHAQSNSTCFLPSLLQNGTVADATAVMNNLNTLQGCVTAKAFPAVMSYTGIIPGTGATGDISSTPNYIYVQADSSQPQTALNSAMTLAYNYGGSSVCLTSQCSHVGLWTQLNKNAMTAGVSFDTGIFSNVVISAPASGSAYQQMYGINAQVVDTATGGGYGGVVGGEIDISLHKNNDVIKEGWAVASVPLSGQADSYQGTASSDGYGLWAGGSCGSATLAPIGSGAGAGGSNCVGFNTGIQFGRWDSFWPIADGGTVIGSPTSGVGDPTKMKAQHGIDFHLVNFSGFSEYFPGFTVTNNPIVMGFAGSSAGFNPTVLTINGDEPSLVIVDNITSPTAGGMLRMTDVAGVWRFQFNTAAGGDFTTVNEPLVLTSSVLSGVQLPRATTGTPVAALCLDSGNNVIKKVGTTC